MSCTCCPSLVERPQLSARQVTGLFPMLAGFVSSGAVLMMWSAFATHSSQIWAFAPATSFFTWSSLLPQNEQRSFVDPNNSAPSRIAWGMLFEPLCDGGHVLLESARRGEIQRAGAHRAAVL